jgi:hypothetical protein
MCLVLRKESFLLLHPQRLPHKSLLFNVIPAPLFVCSLRYRPFSFRVLLGHSLCCLCRWKESMWFCSSCLQNTCSFVSDTVQCRVHEYNHQIWIAQPQRQDVWVALNAVTLLFQWTFLA